jgi:ubiquinone/menaquinone biosynthesis C-methylase UbiE
MSKLEKAIQSYVLDFQGGTGRSPEVLDKKIRQRIFEEKLFDGLIEKLKKIFPDFKGYRILEIGSGTGGLGVALSLTGTKVFGIEPSPFGVAASIERAKRYPDSSAYFCVGKAECLPFKDGFFDLVISSAVLEHVGDIGETIREMYRVLKPNGKIYHEIPNYLFPIEPHYKIMWVPLMPKSLGRIYAKLRGKNPLFLNHLNYTTPSKVNDYFSSTGFFNLRNLYLDEFLGKFENPDLFNRRYLRKIGRWGKQIGLQKWIQLLIKKSYFYPAIYLVGEKRAS